MGQPLSPCADLYSVQEMYRYYPCKIPEWQAAVELAALDIPRLWCERERLPRKDLERSQLEAPWNTASRRLHGPRLRLCTFEAEPVSLACLACLACLALWQC